MKAWCSFELDPDSFWSKTPRLIALILDARGQVVAGKHNEIAWAVWHVAALMRAKKLPKLERLQGRSAQRRRQTTDEMLSVVRMLQAAYGGTLSQRKC